MDDETTAGSGPKVARKIHEYEAESIVVRYEPKRCIHAAKCVRGLPAVFNPELRRWIAPENGAVEEIVEVIGRCPSGALSHTLPAAGAAAAGGPKTSVRALPNGPVIVEGALRIQLADGSERQQARAALCRCGASATKPFCDGQHAAIGFEAE